MAMPSQFFLIFYLSLFTPTEAFLRTYQVETLVKGQSQIHRVDDMPTAILASQYEPPVVIAP